GAARRTGPLLFAKPRSDLGPAAPDRIKGVDPVAVTRIGRVLIVSRHQISFAKGHAPSDHLNNEIEGNEFDVRRVEGAASGQTTEPMPLTDPLRTSTAGGSL